MENNELDDLFRSNADYLGDEPPRGFDKEAFWQHLQAELPQKAERRQRPTAWWWAAASVLLAGMWGGIWWMQSAESKVKTIAAQKTNSPETLRLSEAGADLNRAFHATKVGPLRGQTRVQEQQVLVSKNKIQKENFAKKDEHHAAPPKLDPVTAMRTPAAPLPIVEKTLSLPEVVAPVLLEKPAYRVVHINEIRERKQQEAKARSRVAFRIGLPSSGSEETTANDNATLLNIPIQH